LIELAEVVETHLGRRQIAEGADRGLLSAQIAQEAIADPPPRDGSQMLLDGLERLVRTPGGLELEPHREQRREPSDGARQIDACHEIFPSMPFELDDRRQAAVEEGACERGQEHFVDLRAVRGVDLVQQRLRLPGAQVERHVPPLDVLRRSRFTSLGREAATLAAPPRQLRFERHRTGVLVERPRPGREGRGGGSESQRLAGLQLLAGHFQVLEKDAPGDAVHCEVMDDHQQAARLGRAEIEMDDPQQRPTARVEAGRYGFRARLDRRPVEVGWEAREIEPREGSVHRVRRDEALGPRLPDSLEAQP
jgi:hypothetical protein